jgi:hypothetical protein
MPSTYTCNTHCPVHIPAIPNAQYIYLQYPMPSTYTCSTKCPVHINSIPNAQYIYLQYPTPSAVHELIISLSTALKLPFLPICSITCNFCSYHYAVLM